MVVVLVFGIMGVTPAGGVNNRPQSPGPKSPPTAGRGPHRARSRLPRIPGLSNISKVTISSLFPGGKFSTTTKGI